MKVFLLHGYNATNSQTYGELPFCLSKLGYPIETIELGRYVSLDDNVGIHQLALGLQSALQHKLKIRAPVDNPIVLPAGSKPWAMITHSMGALIFLAWFAKFYTDPSLITECPFKYAIHLAPAYFGSRLAHYGRSWANRLRQNAEGHSIGVKLLDQLELGAVFQTDLAKRLLNQIGSQPLPYLWVSIAGTYRYRLPRGLRQPLFNALSEPGTDGIVRVAATNPNLQYWTIHDSAQGIKINKVNQRDEWLPQPLVILPEFAHTEPFVPWQVNRGIVSHLNRSSKPALGTRSIKSGSRLLGLIQMMLAQPNETQSQLLQLAESLKANQPQFAQIIVEVCNSEGEPVKDFHLNWYCRTNDCPATNPGLAYFNTNRRASVNLASQVASFKRRIINVYRNKKSPHRVVFYLDVEKLSTEQVGLILTAKSHTPLFGYRRLELQFSSEQAQNLFRAHTTAYLEIRLRTAPTAQLLEFLRYHPATHSAISSKGVEYQLPISWNDVGVCLHQTTARFRSE